MMLKSIEPIEGLKIYFTNEDRGCYYTPSISNLAGVPLARILHKENKMTREEAIDKLISIGIDAYTRGNILGSLQVLGLIKFEEANKAYDCRDVILDCGRSTVAWKVIQGLQELGYKVTKI